MSSLQPENVDQRLEQIKELNRAGRLKDAELCCQQLLSLAPGNAQAWFQMGMLRLQLNQLDTAEAALRQAIAVDATRAAYWNNLSVVLYQQGRGGDAESCARQALRLQPENSVVWRSLGNALFALSRWPEAAHAFRESVARDDSDVEAWINLGASEHKSDNFAAAEIAYERALALAPYHSIAATNLALLLTERGEMQRAIDLAQLAISLNERDPAPWNALGNAHFRLDEIDKAESCYARAVEIAPNDADALINLANALRRKSRIAEAEALARRATRISPENAMAHSSLAHLLLLQGDFEHGWAEYEWRWKAGRLAPRGFSLPQWAGEPLTSKTILLHAEQGFGDTFQFIRYAPLVKRQGASVVVECQPPLMKLLARCPGIDRLIAQGDELPVFDVHAPLLSLPGIFKTTLQLIPANVPYLFADPALIDPWSNRLKGPDGYRIGVNWHGRAGQGIFRRRDIPIECLKALAELPGVRLISLQKSTVGSAHQPDGGSGNNVEEADAGSKPVGTAHPTIVDLGPIDDANGAFMDTAAIMMNLDLVITSDTSIAHLAGALGVPVWVALPLVPDWRWLLERSDSPWYPTMRLFRQKSPGDWSGVFEEIRSSLLEELSRMPTKKSQL